MNYTKYEMNGYNLHIIKTNKFKTITIRINLKQKMNKELMTMRRVLTETLIQSSKKYPSRRLLEEKCEDLYGISIGCNNFKSGSYDIISISESFLNEKFTEPGMNKESFEFLLQILCNPNIKENIFDAYSLNVAKRIIKDNIDSFSDYPKSYSKARLLEVLAPNSPISYRGCGYLKDLKKINVKNLYEYYKQVIDNDIMDIVIVGNVEEKEMKKMIEQKFSRIGKFYEADSHFIIERDIKKKPLIIKEKQNINQSQLLIGCNFEELSDFELRYVLNVYSFILGGSGDSLLFKTVREKNSLCYSVSSTYNIISGLLIISAGISAKNYEKTVKLIEESLDKMKNGEFDEKEILKAKTIFKNSCIEITDAPGSIISTYLSHEYLNSDLIEDKMKKIDLVTKDMVVSLANKIHINTIYLLEGGSHEKEI